MRDSHRARFPVGDWTDDSDQMICILGSLLQHGGELNVKDIAYRIAYVSMGQIYPNMYRNIYNDG